MEKFIKAAPAAQNPPIFPTGVMANENSPRLGITLLRPTHRHARVAEVILNYDGQEFSQAIVAFHLNGRAQPSSLMPMADQVQEHPGELEVEVEQFTKLQFISEVLQGLSIALGLSFLWVLEIGRNALFRLLDRLNVRARPRRGTAFPPGPVRRHTTVNAQR